MPEMIYVDSSNIQSVGYVDDTLDLYVQFLSGALYVYHGVPRGIFEGLLAAPSKGSFFNREVKNVYQFSKQ
jgi:hypothetical protein